MIMHDADEQQTNKQCRQRREDRAGDPPRRHRLQPGVVAAGVRQRQGPGPEDARPRPLHPAHVHTQF